MPEEYEQVKWKIYNKLVRSAMMYGLGMAQRKRQAAELEVAELKMLRFSLGMTRMDRNEDIRVTAQVELRCLDMFRKGKQWSSQVGGKEKCHIESLWMQ